MRLVCISDTHNAHKGLQLPEGDVLMHAGDSTGEGRSTEVERFLDWFAAQPHRHKLLIAGNHDWHFQRHPDHIEQLLAERPGITYLQDSGIELEGVPFWGSPWQPWFCDWAFNLPRKGPKIREKWSLIPLSTEVLITHGPPHGIRDQVHGGPHLGCEELRIRLAAVRPRVHVFGHIHDSYGVSKAKDTVYVNASSCDEKYRATNRPVVIDLKSSSVDVHGIEPGGRRERVAELQALLASPGADPLQALKGLAALRGVSEEDLAREYAKRGILADLGRLTRAESKPGKRPVPYEEILG